MRYISLSKGTSKSKSESPQNIGYFMQSEHDSSHIEFVLTEA